MTHPRTGSRAQRRGRIAPTRNDLVDAGFLTVLTLLALVGFRSTFDGSGYLIAGGVAVLVGILIAHLMNAWRAPVLATLGLVVLAYYLFGGVLVRSAAIGGVLPGPGVVRGLSSALEHSWKQVLTTLPPVATDGPLLAVPYLIGLLSGAVGFTVARRWRAPAAPALVPLLAVAAVILLGTARPSARLWQGLVFVLVALAWTVVRAQRRLAATRSSAAQVAGMRRTRVLIGVGLVAVAGAGSWLIGPHLPGSGNTRVVLRNYVHTPFDLAAYPSPLVGFRKYTKDANLLYDQQLFTVQGLAAGDQIQIATLDNYDGSVWSATNGTVPSGPGQPLDAFQRVGSRIATDAAGQHRTITVHIAAAYAGSSDLDAWLPSAGSATSISFSGPDAASYSRQLRYNLATGSGIVAGGLRAGTSYTVHAVVGSPGLGPDSAPFGQPSLPSSADGFVGARADKWSAKLSGVVPQVEAVGKYLRDNGAYSDGGPGQAQYLPGHSMGRLTTFLNAPQLVGDDEQYAAAFALMANYLGLPARVVLAAVPEANGVVEGKDVLADVQVHVLGGAGGSWVTIPRSAFMPDRSKQPDKQPPQQIQNAAAAVVPPPNPIQPPSTLDQSAQPEQSTRHLATHHPAANPWQLPGWIVPTLEWVGIPLLFLIVVAAMIVAVKYGRRQLRRRRGSPAERFSTGWRELVDHARDLGAVVPAGRTRREEARVVTEALVAGPVLPLADAADAGVFAGAAPDQAAATAYWGEIDSARGQLSRGVGRAGRVRAALSLRSFRGRPAAGAT